MTFRPLTPADLAAYVATGEWKGRAGGYAIQGRGAALVKRVEGDYLNVVGLPAALLVAAARRALPGRLRLRLTVQRPASGADLRVCRRSRVRGRRQPGGYGGALRALGAETAPL